MRWIGQAAAVLSRFAGIATAREPPSRRRIANISACSDELDRCSNVSSDSREGSSGSVHGDFPKHRLNKCKGTCPASYTRFTTIRRHSLS